MVNGDSLHGGDFVMNALEVLINTPFTPITYDEWHAFALGSMGFWLGRAQKPELAAFVAICAIFGYLPDTESGRTINKETWYFLGGMLTSYLIGRYT